MQLKVPDMSCAHCKAAIEKAVLAADPAAQLGFDLPAQQVSVTSTLSPEAVQALLDHAGYPSQHLSG